MSRGGLGKQRDVVGVGLGVRPDADGPQPVVQNAGAVCGEAGDPDATGDDAELDRRATWITRALPGRGVHPHLGY